MARPETNNPAPINASFEETDRLPSDMCLGPQKKSEQPLLLAPGKTGYISDSTDD